MGLPAFFFNAKYDEISGNVSPYNWYHGAHFVQVAIRGPQFCPAIAVPPRLWASHTLAMTAATPRGLRESWELRSQRKSTDLCGKPMKYKCSTEF